MRRFNLIGTAIAVLSLVACGQVAPDSTSVATVSPTPGEEAALPPVNPAVALNPTSGRVGTWVTVSGTGFPPDSPVTLLIGSSTDFHEYTQITANSDGQVTMMLGMPATWPDGRRIMDPDLFVRLQSGEDRSAEAAFWLSLPPTSTPSSTPAFTPGTVNTEDSTPEPTGLPTVTLSPSNTPRPTATPLPDLNPVIELNPSTPSVGATVTVSGTDFPPSAPITISLGLPNGDGVRVAEGRSSEGGDFSLSFTMPTQWGDGTPLTAGKLEVRARSSVGGWYAWVTFDYKGR